MGRIGRNPGYDLTNHIITGKRGPHSGSGIARDIDDDMIDRDDPQEFGAGDGRFGFKSMEQMLTETMRGTNIDTALNDMGERLDVKAFSNANINEMDETQYGALPNTNGKGK